MEELLRSGLVEAAQHPALLYTFVIVVLTLSSFGLPFPEEAVLLTVGMIANVALTQAAASGGEPTIHPATLATVCFLAVFLSDYLVFWLGRVYGTKLLRRPFFSRLMTPPRLRKIERWTRRYGAWAAGAFRFTPGLRFPGHFMCGATGLSPQKFMLTDGTAALLSVPTQVLFMAYYGEQILLYIQRFKFVVLALAAVAFLVWWVRRRKRAKPTVAASGTSF